MASLLYVTEKGSYEDFVGAYTAADAHYSGSGGRTLLFKSVANRDIGARVAITTRLLDDGADPSVVSDGLNVLHVLFGRRGHDPEREAPMLRRLLDGGADINQVSKRYGPPLVGLIEHGPIPESAAIPFYDVIFQRPDLDFSVPYGRRTLRDLVCNSAYNLPLLRERVLDYEAAGKDN